MPPEARTSHRNGQVEWKTVPIECLPIPYSLTDFGRAFLEAERARAEAEELAAGAHRCNASLLRPLAPHERR